jgi:hypothetical protein
LAEVAFVSSGVFLDAEQGADGGADQGDLVYGRSSFELPEFGLSVVPNIQNVPTNEGIEKAACAA